MHGTATPWYWFSSASPEMTEAFAAGLVPQFPPGAVLPLYGDLGSGKTVFARGVARGLGITEPVTSPTFAIAQEYRAPGGLWLFHLDLYRIADDNEALAFGLDEYLFAPDAVTLVEWPERIAGLLAAEASETAGRIMPVSLENDGSHQRRIRVPVCLIPVPSLTSD